MLRNCFLCQKPCEDTCTHCGLGSYCCDDHLSVHRNRDVCYPFEIRRLNDVVGNVMVATR